MIDLMKIGEGDNPGIDREEGSHLAISAAICLEKQGHTSGVPLGVRGIFSGGHNSGGHNVKWTGLTAQNRRTRADTVKATEEGAQCIAVVVADCKVGLKAILRSHRGTGVDYWLGNADRSSASKEEIAATAGLSELLEDDSLVAKARLEVSGILSGSDPQVAARSSEKREQARKSSYTGLPAYVIVVEFGRPLAEVSVV